MTMTKAVLSERPMGTLENLSEEHQNTLINCHSYKKYWWYRKHFEQDMCPLCTLPGEIYPRFTYKNDHWIVAEDTFAEKEGRLQTIIIVHQEHTCWFDWNSHYAIADLKRVNDWVLGHMTENIYGHGGTEFIRIGDGRHSIDTAPEHCNWTIIIPDGTADVLVPVFKGPKRQAEIKKRTLEFAERYEAGEIPQ